MTQTKSKEQKTEDGNGETLYEVYPELSGTDATFESVKDALRKAARTGERQHVGRTVDKCRDWREECNLDHVHYYVRPDGTIAVERTHTW